MRENAASQLGGIPDFQGKWTISHTNIATEKSMSTDTPAVA